MSFHYKHRPKYKPEIAIVTTYRCNYRCAMCYWGDPETAKKLTKNDPTMSMPLFHHVLDEVAPYGSTVALTTAGEFLMDPLIKERLPALNESLQKHPHVRYHQTTNASELSEENLQFLKGVKSVGFVISIDSLDALGYATIRHPGTLSKVMTNILGLRENLAKIGVTDVHLQLNVVLMKRNIISLPDVLHLAKKINAIVYVDHPQGFGPKESLNKEALFKYPVFTNNFLEKCEKLAGLLNVGFDRPPPFAVTPDEIEIYHNQLKENKLSCRQLNETGPIQLQANGDVGVCCQNVVFGNLNEQPFEEIINGPKYNKYNDAIANGKPLAPCDTCRFLYREAPYLYDSSIYQLDIPPESRNLDSDINLVEEGFFDWVDELTDRRLRKHIESDYIFKWNKITSSGLSEQINAIEKQTELNWKLVSWARENKTIFIYPSGKQAEGLLKNTPLSLLNIIGFSDRNKSLHGGTFKGFPIYSPEEIQALNPDIFLIASTLYKEEIKAEFEYLIDAGVEIVTL